jgi:hypothetical protein
VKNRAFMASSNGPHLSTDRIRDSAENNHILEPDEFTHIQNCDKCSDEWWKLRQQAKHKTHDTHDAKKAA